MQQGKVAMKQTTNRVQNNVRIRLLK